MQQEAAKTEDEEEVVSDVCVNVNAPGYLFPAGAFRNMLLARPELTGHLPISDKAVVYLSAVLEYLAAEIINVGCQHPEARRPDDSHIRVLLPQDVFLAVENDPELMEPFAEKLSELKSEERLQKRRRLDLGGMCSLDDSRLHAVCDALQRETRRREATREFCRQFGQYFNKVVDEDSETERVEDGESEEEEGQQEEREEGYCYPLLSASSLRNAAPLQFVPPSPSHTSSSSSSPSSSSSSSFIPSPDDTCSRLQRMFSNLAIIQDEEDVTYKDNDEDDINEHETTYTTTYRVMTPPRIVHTATREITLASGLPAPVVNIITDYYKHEMEGEKITAQYSVGMTAGGEWTQHTFVIFHRNAPYLSIIRSPAHEKRSGDYVRDALWQDGEGPLVKHLLNKLPMGVSLCKEDIIPFLCMLFSPHIAPEQTERILLHDGHLGMWTVLPPDDDQ